MKQKIENMTVNNPNAIAHASNDINNFGLGIDHDRGDNQESNVYHDIDHEHKKFYIEFIQPTREVIVNSREVNLVTSS